MICARFEQLKRLDDAGNLPELSLEEYAEYQRTLAGYYRSCAAARAVATKRRKYTKWPTRRNDHKPR